MEKKQHRNSEKITETKQQQSIEKRDKREKGVGGGTYEKKEIGKGESKERRRIEKKNEELRDRVSTNKRKIKGRGCGMDHARSGKGDREKISLREGTKETA